MTIQKFKVAKIYFIVDNPTEFDKEHGSAIKNIIPDVYKTTNYTFNNKNFYNILLDLKSDMLSNKEFNNYMKNLNAAGLDIQKSWYKFEDPKSGTNIKLDFVAEI